MPCKIVLHPPQCPGQSKLLSGVRMNKSINEPHRHRESKSTVPLEEANKVKQQKAEVGEVVRKPKEETQKGHKRTR